MIKEARKPSMDPAQEKLRQSKAAWNKEVSSFINDVIHVKKLLNGWPSKFYKERSKITFPVPVDAAGVLNNLASKFQELSQEGVSIAQQQAEYSKSRRQKRTDQANQTLNKLDEKYGPTGPETPSPLAPTPPSGSDLSKQLATWEQKYELVVEGSNPFSRFLARLTTPKAGFGPSAQKRRLRMDMLDAALKSYKALSKMQVFITKSSKQSILDAYKAMQEGWSEWSVVSRNFNFYVNSTPDQPIRPEEMRDEPFPQGDEPDLRSSQPKVTPIVPPTTLPKAEVELPKPVVKKQVNTSPPLKDTEPPAGEQSATDQLEVVAQAFLKKWLGKTRHQILPGRSSGLRLQIFQLAESTRKNINKIMTLLEKGLNIEELGPLMSEISGQQNTMRSLMRSLHTTEKGPPGKGKTSVLDGIF